MNKLYVLSTILFISLTIIFTSFAQSSNDGIQSVVLSTSTSSTAIEFTLTNYNQKNIEIEGSSTVLYTVPGSICYNQPVSSGFYI